MSDYKNKQLNNFLNELVKDQQFRISFIKDKVKSLQKVVEKDSGSKIGPSVIASAASVGVVLTAFVGLLISTIRGKN